MPQPRLRACQVATRFFEEMGFKHYELLTADGALEAAPAVRAPPAGSLHMGDLTPCCNAMCRWAPRT